MQYRIDPSSLYYKDYKNCCRIGHPTRPFYCSRIKGHKGMHFAQYVTLDMCARAKPNPWPTSKDEKVYEDAK